MHLKRKSCTLTRFVSSCVVRGVFTLAASGLFPAILLGIFDRRRNAQGAIAGMLVGLGFTTVMIALMRAPQLFGVPKPS